MNHQEEEEEGSKMNEEEEEERKEESKSNHRLHVRLHFLGKDSMVFDEILKLEDGGQEGRKVYRILRALMGLPPSKILLKPPSSSQV